VVGVDVGAAVVIGTEVGAFVGAAIVLQPQLLNLSILKDLLRI
jgi:hypothetical protein